MAMADDERGAEAWPIEAIPDGDDIYMRIHLRSWVSPSGRLSSAAFQNRGSGMSVEWAKYATPEQTRSRSDRHPPTAYGIVAMVTGVVRAIPGQRVEHEPLPENQAHSEVFGEKDEEARMGLLRAARRVLGFDPNSVTT